MKLHDIDCLTVIPITSVETGNRLDNITAELRSLWDTLMALLSDSNYTPTSEHLNPLFLHASAAIFQGTIEPKCYERAIAAIEKARELAIARNLDDLYCELLICHHWLILGVSIAMPPELSV